MKIVAHILKSKPEQAVYTITPAASVFDAVKLMAEKSIGALVVMEGEKVVGIITERDYARKIILMARSSKETPVRDIMTSSVMYVRPDQTSEECMVLMTENRLRHLAGHGQRQADRSHLHRRPGERHHLRAEIHHPTARTLHHGGAELSLCMANYKIKLRLVSEKGDCIRRSTRSAVSPPVVTENDHLAHEAHCR